MRAACASVVPEATCSHMHLGFIRYSLLLFDPQVRELVDGWPFPHGSATTSASLSSAAPSQHGLRCHRHRRRASLGPQRVVFEGVDSSRFIE